MLILALLIYIPVVVHAALYYSCKTLGIKNALKGNGNLQHLLDSGIIEMDGLEFNELSFSFVMKVETMEVVIMFFSILI